MGAALSEPQKDMLETYRNIMLSVLDYSLVHTKTDENHISIKRLQVCRKQLEGITLNMVFELAKKWSETCFPLLHTSMQVHTLETYTALDSTITLLSPEIVTYSFQQLETLKFPLIGKGSTEDIYFVVTSLEANEKTTIIDLFIQSVFYANTISNFVVKKK